MPQHAYKVESVSQGGFPPGPSLRCPACHQIGTFEHLPGIAIPDVVLGPSNVYMLQRRCPNPSCNIHLFCIAEHSSHQVVATFPPERIDLDATGIPAPVVEAMDEAITCHANGAYVAAAIMVRKTLEELCHDRQATGNDLKQRLDALKETIILPEPFMRGLDALRYLGNDAAHVEARVYNEIGKAEVEAGIAVSKKLLEAVYQYDSIVGHLEALKRAEAE